MGAFEGGNATVLCQVFRRGGAVPAVQEIFARVERGNSSAELPDDYLQGAELHRALGACLGMPTAMLCFGYDYVEELDGVDEHERARFIKVGARDG